MEMSRQRIRASVLESTMKPCPHCGGTGHVRSDSSVALMVVRAIEEFLLKDSRSHITVRTPAATALYVLNHKRGTLVELESRFGLTITLEADDTVGSQHYAIFRGALAEKPEGFVEARSLPAYVEPEEPEDDIVVAEEEDEAPAQAEQPRQPQQGQQQRASEDGEGRDRKRRKRRRRRGGRDRDREHGAPTDGASVSAPSDFAEAADAEGGEDAESDDTAPVTAAEPGETVQASEEGAGKKRRRGKRGGKRNKREDGEGETEAGAEETTEPAELDASESEPASAEPVAVAIAEEPAAPVADEAPVTEKPKKPRRAAKPKKAAAEAVAEVTVVEAVEQVPAEVQPAAVEETVVAAVEEEPAKARPSRRKPASADTPAVPVVSSTVAEQAEAKAEEKPKRAGWWQRKGFF